MNLEVWSTPPVIMKFGVFVSNWSRMVFSPPPGPIRVKILVSMSRSVSISDIDVNVDAPPPNGGGSGVYGTEVRLTRLLPGWVCSSASRQLYDFLFRGIDVQGFPIWSC